MKLPRKLAASIAAITTLALLCSQEMVWAVEGIDSLRVLAWDERNNTTDIVNDNPALLDEGQTRLYRDEFLAAAQKYLASIGEGGGRRWTLEQIARIPEAIRRLHDAGIEIHDKAIRNNRDEEITRLISETLGRRNSSGLRLFAIARKIAKSWDDVIRASGLDPEEIKKRPKWTPEQDARIPDAIKALHEAGIDVNRKALMADTSERTLKILSERLGRRNTNASALIQRLRKINRSWDDVLKVAGLDPKKVNRWFPWNVEQEAKIPNAILALYEGGIGVNAGVIQFDESEETKRLISEKLGRRDVTGRRLYLKVLQSKKYNRSWDNALRAAGFNPDEIRGYLVWTSEQEARIPDAIRALYEAGIDVNSGTMQTSRRSEKITKIISEKIERANTTSATLYDYVIKRVDRYQKSWDNALIAAGLDPEEIKKPGVTFGKRSWWKDRYYPSILARDTAVILAVTGLIPESVIRRGKNWERPFYKNGGNRASYVDFYSNNAHGLLIFEPHGTRNGESLEEYRRRRLQEYQGTWAAEVPQENVFVFGNTRTLIRDILPRLGIEVTPVQLAQIDQLIAASEEETRQRLAEYAAEDIEPGVAMPELGELSPELTIAMQAI